MVKEGVLENPAPSAIFGLHVYPDTWQRISYNTGGVLASCDGVEIVIHGRQTHGAEPWRGVDPIVVAAQVVLGLQTISSRQIPLTTAPAVVSIGSIHGGNRDNVIPDEVKMLGTIRTLDPKMRHDVHQRIRQTVTKIAESAGATAEVNIRIQLPVTYNDPELTIQMSPTLTRVAGNNIDPRRPAELGADDFSFYVEKIPGLFITLGTAPKDSGTMTLAPLHSPRFYLEESALITGVRALSNLAVDYLFMQSQKQ